MKPLAIHCPTRELSELVIEHIKSLGLSVPKEEFYSMYGEETCLYIDYETNEVLHDSKWLFTRAFVDIVEAKEFLKQDIMPDSSNSPLHERKCLTEDVKGLIEEVILILESKKPSSVKYAIEKLKEILK